MRPIAEPGDEAPDAALPRMGESRVQARYKVRFGETVYLLVRRFYGKLTERNVQAFLELNPSIKSPGKILEGSYVLVPSSRPVLDEKLGDKH
jgi:phage tail protein X